MKTRACILFWLSCLTAAFSVRAQQDLIPPTLVSASSVGGGYVGLCFSEPVETVSAQTSSNYSVNDGTVQLTQVALLPDGRTVQLALSSPVNGPFTVLANGVRDLSGLSIAANSTVTGEVWALGTDVIGTPPGVTSPPGTNFSCRAGDVDVLAGGQDIWDTADEFHFVYQPRQGDFDVAVRLQRLDVSDMWAKASLMARETLHGNSRTIQLLAYPIAWPGAAQVEMHFRPTIGSETFIWSQDTMPGTEVPNQWFRLKRFGDIFRCYYGTDGINWTRLSTPFVQPMNSNLLVGLATTSHNTSQSVVAEYRDFHELQSGRVDPAVVGLLALQDQVARIGDQVTFLAEVPGSSGYSFQWQKNGISIPAATGAVFRIPAAGQTDAGTYSVRVRNVYGALEESAAELSLTQLLIPFTNVWRYDVSRTDLGTAWKEPSFVDGSWMSGPAPFGFETTPQFLPMPILTPFVRDNRITYYFRSSFNFTNDPADVHLNLRTLFDDGGVVYLNGVAWVSPAMGSGALNFNVPAVINWNNAFVSRWERLPSSLLVKGQNSIAVEMHQVGPTSSDMVFALELVAEPSVPTELLLTDEPDDVLVESSKPATLSVKVTGNRARYQWFKDGMAVAGATQSTYSIPSAALSHQGNYHVVASNAVGVLSSRAASLVVVADTMPPRVINADGTLSPTNVLVNFSESVTPATATNLVNYTITNMLGGTLAISRAILTNDSIVMLTTVERQAQQNYQLLVRNVQDRAAPSNTMAATQQVPISSLVPLIPAVTDWLYYDTVLDPPLVGTAWREENYDTSLWYSLPAPFVLESETSVLPLPPGQLLSQGQVTTYFRIEFQLGAGIVRRLRFRHYVDDGAVFYLNGTEVLRYNMPAGPITDQTVAASIVGKGWPIDAFVPGTLLRVGTNLLAVELHGEQVLDPDLYFALELSAEMDSFPGGPLQITEQPRNQTGSEGQPVTFQVTGSGAATVQWERNGQAIPGATQSTYTIPAVDPGMNGMSFSVVLSNLSGGMLRSQSAVLTVQPDLLGPRLLSASGWADVITLQFSEPVTSASATQTVRYMVRNSLNQLVPVTRAEIGQAPDKVILSTAELTERMQHTVGVSGVTDRAAAANPVPADSQVMFTALGFVPGLVKAESYSECSFTPGRRALDSLPEIGFITGQTIADLTRHPSFPDAPKFSALKNTWELSVASDHGAFFGARISGFFTPRQTGLHIFYLCTDDEGELWLSPDALREHKLLIAREPVWADRRHWTGTMNSEGMVNRPNQENISAPIHLVAGRRYYMESLMKEWSGGPEGMAVAVQEPGDSGPPENGSPAISSVLLGGYWEVAGISPRFSITRQPAPQTGEQGGRVTLQVSVHSGPSAIPGGGVVHYQWQRNGVDIPGATGALYTTPLLSAAEDGSEYRVVMRTAEGAVVVSEAMILQVVETGSPSFLQIHRGGMSDAIITWERSGYLLQQCESLSGPWQPASIQVSPSVVPLSEGERFFRLIRR